MDYQVYIIFSEKLSKYYAGHTADLDKRIAEHNSGKADFTSKGIPWKMIHCFSCGSKSEAVQLETSIKKGESKDICRIEIFCNSSGRSAAR